MKELFLRNIKYGSAAMFNEDNNWRFYINILDTYFQASSSTSILNPKEYNSFFIILDNLIYSMKKPNTTIEDPDKVFTYFNTLIRSTLNGVAINDPIVSYAGTFYTYHTEKTTYCKILLKEIDFRFGGGFMYANFTLRPNQVISPSQCMSPIDVIFMVFRPNYTSKGSRDQTLIYLDIRDSITGKSLIDIFSFFLSATNSTISSKHQHRTKCLSTIVAYSS